MINSAEVFENVFNTESMLQDKDLIAVTMESRDDGFYLLMLGLINLKIYSAIMISSAGTDSINGKILKEISIAYAL